jgi:NAD(P)-dependent dehydrogenase (short-subunit alcohol dehydrogenase family)
MGKITGKIAVITGGAQGIGQCIARQFADAGAQVCIIDLQENPCFVGDLSQEADLRAFAGKVLAEYGHVDYLINNAAPLFKGLPDCSWEEFNYALKVGVAAPYMLTQLFQEHFAPGAAIVNISSSRDRMSMPGSESYTAAKGGIAALTHALAVSLSGRVRVNSISPGWIETGNAEYKGADATQHPAGRVGRPEDIAEMVLFLCSARAGFITGENICIDGGMTRQMIYHGDHGWQLNPGK